jgi:CRP-like cAMP-binding protein
LLDALSPAEQVRIYPQLEWITLPLGFALYESGLSQKYAYFPGNAVVSLQCLMTNGNGAETAAVGAEGMVGTPIVMGADSTHGRAVVKFAGMGFRLKAQVIRREFDRAGRLMKLLLRYIQALITQTSQNAVCTRHHSIDQRFCRSLLMSLDRTLSTEMLLTQDLLANLLGTRRESVTETAGRLQKAGLIRYARGHITIIDRGGLEKHSCECYAVTKRECGRLLTATGAPSSNRSLSGSPGRNRYSPKTDFPLPVGLHPTYSCRSRGPTESRPGSS